MTADHSHPTTDELMRKRGYVTTEEAARLIGKTPAAIRNLVHEERLRYVRVGDGPKAPIYVEHNSLVEYVGEDAARVLGLTKTKTAKA